MSRPWFRYHRKTLNSPKVQRLSPILFKAWVNILCATDDDGNLPSLNDLPFVLRVGEALVTKWVGDLIGARLLVSDSEGLRAHDWDEWNFPSDGDPTATDRKRKQRDKAKVSRVTSPSRHASVTRTDTESDTEQTQIPKPTVSAGPVEIWEQVWNEGRAYLVAQGQKESDARQALMRWRQNHDELEILRALKIAKQNAVELPIPYIGKVLNGKGLKHAGQHGTATSGALNRIARLAHEAREAENLREGGGV